jgi:hypothetical protein
VIAINGKPANGSAVLGEAVRRHHPGDTLVLEVISPQPNGRTAQHRVELRLAPFGNFRGASAFLFLYLCPYFCFALGFWVAAVRPRDPRAWFLLIFLLAFTSFFEAQISSWVPLLRDYGLIYRFVLTFLSPTALLWLGIFFPEPFPLSGRWRAWYALGWLTLAVAGISAVLYTSAALGELETSRQHGRCDTVSAEWCPSCGASGSSLWRCFLSA